MHATNSRFGFTLIELSTVLIVIGLTVAGIMAGREFLVVAELRKQARRPAEITTMLNAFRDRYRCIPGDCNKAAQFFGYNPSVCAFDLTAMPPGTCNGDGTGFIGYDLFLLEPTLFFQHLQLAGIGTFSWSMDTSRLPRDSLLGTPQMPLHEDNVANIWPTTPVGSRTYWTVNAEGTSQSASLFALLDHKYDDGNGFAGSIKVNPTPLDLSSRTSCVDASGIYALSDGNTRDCTLFMDLRI